MSRELPAEWAAAMITAGCVDPRRKDTVASMTQLADRAGLAVETVRRMISGKGVSHTENIAAVAAILGDDVFDWVERARQNADPWTAPPEAALLSADEGETLTRLIRQLTAHRRRPGQPQLRVIVGQGEVENPEDFDKAAAHWDPEPAGPPDNGE